jgi:hypothetical protein
MKIIRNGVPLDEEELNLVKTLSNKELIEIIEINNKNINLYNKIIENNYNLGFINKTLINDDE